MSPYVAASIYGFSGGGGGSPSQLLLIGQETHGQLGFRCLTLATRVSAYSSCSGGLARLFVTAAVPVAAAVVDTGSCTAVGSNAECVPE